MQVNGPYIYSSGKNKGRRYVIIKDDYGNRVRQLLYSRYLMEQAIGRQLLPHEHVDHIDEDKTNDALTNLQILTLAANVSKSAAINRPPEMITFICPECNQPATKSARFVRHNRNQGKAGPFCGRRCAGRFISKRT